MPDIGKSDLSPVCWSGRSFELKGLEMGADLSGRLIRGARCSETPLRNSMGNRLACIFAVPLLIAGSLAAQQTSQGSSTGNGQDSGCSGAYGVNDPNCQQN